EALLKLLARFGRDLLRAENLMIWQQPAAADAEFRITFRGHDAMNQFDSRPHAAGILPTAARAREPFAQNGAASHQTTVVLRKAAGEDANLVGCAHAQRDETGQEAGGNRET